MSEKEQFEAWLKKDDPRHTIRFLSHFDAMLIAWKAARAQQPFDAAEVWNKALELAARIARDACLVPPDGGSPSAEDAELCEEAARQILAQKTVSSPQSLQPDGNIAKLQQRNSELETLLKEMNKAIRIMHRKVPETVMQAEKEIDEMRRIGNLYQDTMLSTAPTTDKT